jgi:hypothetical protein
MRQIACAKIGDGRVVCAPNFDALVPLYARELGMTEDGARAVLRTTWYAKMVETPPRGFQATIAQMVSGVSAVLKDIAGDTVAEKEARRRASICYRCPWKSDTIDCAPCGAYDKIRRALKRNLPEIWEVTGAGCGICHCSCAVMVWAKKEAFRDDAIQHPDRPDSCWVKQL